MTAIQTKVHVGADGMLRLEVPVDQRDRDVLVSLTVKDANGAADFESAGNGIGEDARERLAAAGIRVPASDSWSARLAVPLEIGDSPISDSLVEDRR